MNADDQTDQQPWVGDRPGEASSDAVRGWLAQRSHQPCQPARPATLRAVAAEAMLPRRAVGAGTLRVWKPYVELLSNGSTQPVNGRTLSGFGDRWVHEITVDELDAALAYVRDRAVHNAALRNPTPGRTPRMPDGYGAVRTAVGAWRHVFRTAAMAGSVHPDLDAAAQLRNPRPEHFTGDA